MRVQPIHHVTMKLSFLPSLLVLMLGLAGSLSAQTLSARESVRGEGIQTNSSKQSAEEVEDIGVIDEQQGFKSFRDKLRFNVSARGAYTTNALLRGNHGSSDLLFLPTIEAGFHTPLGKHFTFDFSTKLESVTYMENQHQGFVGYSAMATLDYRIAKGLPRVYVSIEPYRFDNYDTGDMMSSAIGFTGGTDYGVAFNAGRTLGFVGYSFTDYLADPNIDGRLVHRAVLGLAHQIRSNITGQLYGVYQYSDYTDFARDDSKFTIAGNLIYQFNTNLFGSFSAAWVSNDSTQDRASYESFSTSLGLTLQF
jgi:hypothetical protein